MNYSDIMDAIRKDNRKREDWIEKQISALSSESYMNLDEIMAGILFLYEKNSQLLWILFYCITDGAETETMQFWDRVISWIVNDIGDDGRPSVGYGFVCDVDIPIFKDEKIVSFTKDVIRQLSFKVGSDHDWITVDTVRLILKAANEVPVRDKEGTSMDEVWAAEEKFWKQVESLIREDYNFPKILRQGS